MPTHTSSLALDCYVRGGLSSASTWELVERARDLATGQAPVSDVSVHSWPSRIGGTESLTERDLDVYETFARWAADTDASLRPFVTIREAPSEMASLQSQRRDGPAFSLRDETTELVTPGLCIGVYSSSQLVAVFPHTTEAGTYTVEDLLCGLETGASVDAISPAVERATDVPSASETDGTEPEPPSDLPEP